MDNKTLRWRHTKYPKVLSLNAMKKMVYQKVWNWLYAKNHAEDAKIYIYIPEKYELEEADLNLNAGSIYIEDIHAKQLDIDVDAGEVHADYFLTNTLSMDCETGLIEAVGKTLEDADIESGVGEIDFTAIGTETDYNYDLDSDIGSITCGSKEFTELGSEYNIDNQADKTMSIDCGVGDINVQFQAEQQRIRQNVIYSEESIFR